MDKANKEDTIKLINALLECRTVTRIASDMGYSVTTLYSWRKADNQRCPNPTIYEAMERLLAIYRKGVK